MILCIEAFHCLQSAQAMLARAYGVLAEDGSLVIADAFDKSDVEAVESLFRQTGLGISKKEVITFNVKHAMQLDKPRVEKMIAQISGNPVAARVLRNFLGSGEQSRAFEELGRSKDYICYVLKHPRACESQNGRRKESLISGVGQQS